MFNKIRKRIKSDVASSGRGTRVQTTGSQPHMNHNRCSIDIRSHFVQFLVLENSKI